MSTDFRLGKFRTQSAAINTKTMFSFNLSEVETWDQFLQLSQRIRHDSKLIRN